MYKLPGVKAPKVFGAKVFGVVSVKGLWCTGLFAANTCLASVNGKMQSNLSATSKRFFTNMKCHYLLQKEIWPRFRVDRN